eukprot:s3867_g6.t1
MQRFCTDCWHWSQGKVGLGIKPSLKRLATKPKSLLKRLATKPPEEACNKAQKPAGGLRQKAQKPKQKVEATGHDGKNGPGEAWDKAIEAGDADASSEVLVDLKGIPMILQTPEASKEGAKGKRITQNKSAGKGGLKESQSPPSARVPLLSKRALTHKSTLQQQAAEAAEKLATRSAPAKETGKRQANQVDRRPATRKKLTERPAASMQGQKLGKPAMKRPASQSAAAAEHRLETPPEQGSEIHFLKAALFTKSIL